jgi:hypothetical protein
LRCLFVHILNWYQLNQTAINYFHPYHIRNISPSATKHPIPPRRSYSSDKTSQRQADPEMSFLLDKSLPSCDENQN